MTEARVNALIAELRQRHEREPEAAEDEEELGDPHSLLVEDFDECFEVEWGAGIALVVVDLSPEMSEQMCSVHGCEDEAELSETRFAYVVGPNDKVSIPATGTTNEPTDCRNEYNFDIALSTFQLGEDLLVEADRSSSGQDGPIREMAFRIERGELVGRPIPCSAASWLEESACGDTLRCQDETERSVLTPDPACLAAQTSLENAIEAVVSRHHQAALALVEAPLGPPSASPCPAPPIAARRLARTAIRDLIVRPDEMDAYEFRDDGGSSGQFVPQSFTAREFAEVWSRVNFSCPEPNGAFVVDLRSPGGTDDPEWRELFTVEGSSAEYLFGPDQHDVMRSTRETRIDVDGDGMLEWYVQQSDAPFDSNSVCEEPFEEAACSAMLIGRDFTQPLECGLRPVRSGRFTHLVAVQGRHISAGQVAPGAPEDEPALVVLEELAEAQEGAGVLRGLIDELPREAEARAALSAQLEDFGVANAAERVEALHTNRFDPAGESTGD